MIKGFIILIVLIITVGCKCTDCVPTSPPKTIDEVVPEEEYKLLHIAEQWVYKSITKEDYTIEESC